MKKIICLFLILLFVFIIYNHVFARLQNESTGSDSVDSHESIDVGGDKNIDVDENRDADENANVDNVVLESKTEKDITQEKNTDSQQRTDIIESLPQPYFVSPLSNQTLKGEVSIKLKVEDALQVEFYIRRSGALTSVYLGQAVKKDEQTWEYLWQTGNHPNGEHKLYAKIINQYGDYESNTVGIKILNLEPPKEESEEKAKEIVEAEKEIENKTEEEKSKEKEKLKEEIQEETIEFKKETGPTGEKAEPKEISPEEKKEIKESIDQQVVPEVENLDRKIKEIVVIQEQLKKPEIEMDSKKKEEVEAKLNQLVKEKEKIKENIIKKSEEILQLEETSQAQPKKEELRQSIAQHVESLDRFLFSKEKERQDKLREIKNRDSDNDGIPDLEEIRLKTDLLDPDTDKDGYLDGDEVEHGYDPLVPSPDDKIIFEDPRQKGEVRKEYEVTSIEARELKQGVVGILLKGKGLPNSFVTIYIYSSLPIIVVAKTDENGNWSYLLDKPLEDGEHQVYVTVTNNKGEISYKSEPKYFIKQAQAITSVAASSVFDRESLESKYDYEKSLKMAYIFLGLSIVVFCIGVALIIIGLRVSRQNKQ
jgi:hypothetical protein